MESSMEGQQFCLRWHNFQNTLLSSLPKLLDGGYLTDVTLSAGGRHIRAHRIILSACSYYFKELFKDLNTLHHPVIVLPGMEYANLCALVTFMYNGEVNIYQEQLPALLAMADTLHIRGLADIAGKNSSHQHDNGLFIHPTPCNIISEEQQLVNESAIKTENTTNDLNDSNIETEDKDEVLTGEDISCSVKTKPYYSINAKLAQKERKIGKEIVNTVEKNFNDLNEDTQINENMQFSISEDAKPPIVNSDNNLKFFNSSSGSRGSQNCNKTSVTCLICGKQLSNQYNLRVHMETHSNSSYSCTACSHVSRSRDALRKHVSYRHPLVSSQKRSRYGLGKP